MRLILPLFSIAAALTAQTQAPKLSVPGNVLVDGAADLPSVTVVLESVPPARQLRADLSKEGTLSWTGVAPGAYRVIVGALNPPMYVKAIRYGPDDVAEGIVNLASDEDTLTLLLGTDSGQLRGTVQTGNGGPAGHRPVTIAPPENLSNRRDLLKTVLTDSTGGFQASGLAPGDYTVYAWDDPDVPMAEDSDFRRQFAAQASAVTIASGAPATVALKAVPAEEIRKGKEKFRLPADVATHP
jgi:hypothetical protein